jgi:AraC-like DNA-binding protein
MQAAQIRAENTLLVIAVVLANAESSTRVFSSLVSRQLLRKPGVAVRALVQRVPNAPRDHVSRNDDATRSSPASIGHDGYATHHISQAIKWIAKRFAEQISMEALADQGGMSSSAFYSQIKKVTGYSPLNFQKQLRLQGARQIMIREGLEAAEAAFRVGYESPSQFGREYKRLFGKPLRRDVHREELAIVVSRHQAIVVSRHQAPAPRR